MIEMGMVKGLFEEKARDGSCMVCSVCFVFQFKPPPLPLTVICIYFLLDAT